LSIPSGSIQCEDLTTGLTTRSALSRGQRCDRTAESFCREIVLTCA
jgi:hypothetical protein